MNSATSHSDTSGRITATRAAAPNSRNVSELPAAEPDRIHRPDSVDELVSLVREGCSGAGGFRAVSSGFNWGLGSASGPIPGQHLVDLSALDTVRTIDVERGYAIVEAGVTQAQLCDALTGSGRFLNCTASSPETSVLGNTMDRGVGLRHQRTEDLLGLEIVTAAADVGTVGWWPPGSGLAPNKYGLGPSSVQVFPQSTLGIATAAVVRLLPTPEETSVLTFTAADDSYDALIEVLRGAVRDRLSDAVIKVYDADSSDIYGGNATVTGHICLDGSADVVSAKRADLAGRLAPIGARVLPEDEFADDPLAGAVARLYRGDVSKSESIVRASLGRSTHEADAAGRGWIFVLPFVPFTAADLGNARGIVREAGTRHGVEVGTTVNVLGHDVVDLVIAIRFDRASANATEAAHRASDEIQRALVDAGYPPYRLDTAHHRSDVAPGTDLNAVVAARLKDALDPTGLFGPSRYLS
ncbi:MULTISPECIES: FAD-binding oxidoreductase [Prauserella salsuginis group]|uniref:FAD-binding oxidoreductase n=1 Tax=Prauserella salsuginis TaxID=387889 RepID=A0ABW6G7U6_9PSEU|nr:MULTISPECIES: FAD-binding oxidoreductase [Prauserella salsuginis group]